MALNTMFGPQPSSPVTGGISGVKFNRPTGWVDEYGGNGELTGASNWGSYFTGLEQLGEGFAIEDIQSIGGANPTGFKLRRADPNGNKNVYQQRQLSLNPDGSVGWAQGSDWKSHTQQSQMDHFLTAGLPMALAFAGGIGATGGFGGLTGAEGLSGMDLAADAALGTGNNIATAGAGLGTAAPTVGGTGLQVGGQSGMTQGLGSTGLGSSVSPSAGSTLGTTGSGLDLSGSTFGGSLGTGAGGSTNAVTSLIKNLLGGQKGGPSGLSEILNLVSGGTKYNKYDDIMDQIKGIYSPDGAYAKALENRLGRLDAKAGRNSQYGPRLAQMMGMLADGQARALQDAGGMIDNQMGGLNTVLGSGGRILDKGLSTIFGDSWEDDALSGLSDFLGL